MKHAFTNNKVYQLSNLHETWVWVRRTVHPPEAELHLKQIKFHAKHTNRTPRMHFVVCFHRYPGGKVRYALVCDGWIEYFINKYFLIDICCSYTYYILFAENGMNEREFGFPLHARRQLTCGWCWKKFTSCSAWFNMCLSEKTRNNFHLPLQSHRVGESFSSCSARFVCAIDWTYKPKIEWK